MGILKRSHFWITCLISISLSVLLWHHFSKSYYSLCAISYDKYGHPLTTVELEGSKYELEVRIGSKFPLFLSEEMLAGIDKRFYKTAIWHDIDGQRHEAPSYLIKKVIVGDLTQKNVVANQTPNGELGKLGKFLGEEWNFLLDFPHSRIIACDSFSKLRRKEFLGKHWIKTPFELTNGGITIDVRTDIGILKLALNTTSTTNLIRSSLSNSENCFVSRFCAIGDQEFGGITFETIDLPKGLDEIDGFLGMNFLKNQAIYFDYSHKMAHFELSPVYLEQLPVQFNQRGLPSFSVQIEDNSYPLEIDLGSSFPFSLNEEILRIVHKTPFGTAEWSDFRGHRYESTAYTIPKIKIGNLSLSDAIVSENRNEFHVNASLDFLASQQIGAVGLPILEKYNLLLDFRHSSIYACNSYSHLQRAGLLSQHLLVVPFVSHLDGILVCVETDTGPHRLLLDTAATHTAMRAPQF